MPRPRKQGLDYFPLDVGFFDDERISAIFVEFGIKGEITAVKLLCAIYRNGYFAEWNDSLRTHLLRNLPGISPSLLDAIVHSLVQRGFFDQTIFDTARVLTSRQIQECYFSATRRRQPTIMPFLIQRQDASAQLLHAETQLLHAETQLLHAETPQKKIKENKKEEDEKEETPTSSPTTEDFEKEKKTQGDDIIHSRDKQWRQAIQRLYDIDDTRLSQAIDAFRLSCQARGKTHRDTADARSHFCDWLRLQLQSTKPSPPVPYAAVSQQPPQQSSQQPSPFAMPSLTDIERERQEQAERERQRWVSLIRQAEADPQSSCAKVVRQAMRNGTLQRLGLRATLK